MKTLLVLALGFLATKTTNPAIGTSKGWWQRLSTQQIAIAAVVMLGFIGLCWWSPWSPKAITVQQYAESHGVSIPSPKLDWAGYAKAVIRLDSLLGNAPEGLVLKIRQIDGNEILVVPAKRDSVTVFPPTGKEKDGGKKCRKAVKKLLREIARLNKSSYGDDFFAYAAWEGEIQSKAHKLCKECAAEMEAAFPNHPGICDLLSKFYADTN